MLSCNGIQFVGQVVLVDHAANDTPELAGAEEGELAMWQGSRAA